MAFVGVFVALCLAIYWWLASGSKRSVVRSRTPIVGVTRTDTVVQPQPLTPDAEGNNQFALTLHRELRRQGGNLLFCPYGVRSVLRIAYAGAKGMTSEQMAVALHLINGNEHPHREFVDPPPGAVADDEQPRLASATSLWCQEGMPMRSEFSDWTHRNYKGAIQTVDLRESDRARATINAWVDEKTRSKIRGLVPPGGINPNTRLVLVSAVYFKGSWTQQFYTGATRDETFLLDGGDTVPVAMMHQQGEFAYFHHDGWAMVDLGYIGGGISMLVLLPDNNDGLPELEQQLTAGKLLEWVSQMRHEEVSLFLPRFKLTWENELQTALAALGMSDAFTAGKADFSGINGVQPPADESLFLSLVFHKAFIDVDELGTEAAAATASYAEAFLIPEQRSIRTFRADHPFLFAIRSRRSGEILFLGRISDPTKR